MFCHRFTLSKPPLLIEDKIFTVNSEGEFSCVVSPMNNHPYAVEICNHIEKRKTKDQINKMNTKGRGSAESPIKIIDEEDENATISDQTINYASVEKSSMQKETEMDRAEIATMDYQD